MRRPRRTVLPALAGLLALYLVSPLVAGIAHLGSADWRGADWASLGEASAVSLSSATLATALVCLCGVPLGYVLARSGGRAARLLGVVVQLPLALPPLASGVLLLFLFGYASPLGRLTGGRLTDSFAGIVLAEAFVAAPFLIIAARSAFQGVDPVLEEVAATLGHRPAGVFRRVSLPLASRAILAGALLAWLRAFGEFGATVMVAYHPYSLPVYTYVAFGSQGLPAMLPVLLPTLAAAVAAMALAARLRPMPRPGPTHAPADAVTPITAAAPAVLRAGAPFRFTCRRSQGFAMEIAWQTEARRLAILGASGSGKSLTLRAIAGLDDASAVSLSLAGEDLARRAPEQRGIAYVPQGYGLLPHLTVAGQLRFAVGASEAAARHWLDRLGLTGLEDRLPAALSLGQQQRVALARALSRPARLLLLDEPFSALDAPLRHRLRRALRALQAELDVTTILVTHDPDEAFLLADELLILEAGRVLQRGAVEAVFARPAGEAVARLLGAETAATGQATAADRIAIGDGLQIEVAGPPLTPGMPVGWSIRPESLQLVAGGGLPATLLGAAAPRAGRSEISLRLGGATLRAFVEPEPPLATGPCHVRLHPAAVQVWPLD